VKDVFQSPVDPELNLGERPEKDQDHADCQAGNSQLQRCEKPNQRM
jgi:hypothetical protein